MHYSLGIILTALLAVASAQFPKCTPCLSQTCSTPDCYLQCTTNSCPNGYAYEPHEGTICTPPESGAGDPSTKPFPFAEVKASCYKCQIANCSECLPPSIEKEASCIRCNNGSELQPYNNNGTSGVISKNGTDDGPMQCVWVSGGGTEGDGSEDGNGDGDGNTGDNGDNDNNDGGGGSGNSAAIGAGVAAGGVVVLGGAGVVAYILWRRWQTSLLGNSGIEAGLRKKKQKRPDSQTDSEGTEARYTRSPTLAVRPGNSEISELDKLGFAPSHPDQQSYDVLELQRQTSVEPYGQLELNTDNQIYSNQVVIAQANQNNSSNNTYGNIPTAAPAAMPPKAMVAENDGPSDIYGNDEVLQSQEIARVGSQRKTTPEQKPNTLMNGPTEEYMDMSLARAASVKAKEEETDEVYLNEPTPAIEPEPIEEDIYQNEAVGVVEENVYKNT